MAVMGLRLAARRNGVAALHGEVSRGDVRRPVARGAGGRGADRLGDQRGPRADLDLARSWTTCSPAACCRSGTVPRPPSGLASQEVGDDELWRALQQGRERLVSLRAGAAAPGPPGPGLLEPATWPGPTACSTRPCSPSASLAASPPTSAPRCSCPSPTGSGPSCSTRSGPCRWSSRARPTRPTSPGKEMIQQHPAVRRPSTTLRHRFVFLDDYDMAVARALYQGCDIWLNTPRRPQEACGTSGMKAALNGALNCSILDGWWDECFDGQNGWAITSAEDEHDLRPAGRAGGRERVRPAREPDRPAVLRPGRRRRAPRLGGAG